MTMIEKIARVMAHCFDADDDRWLAWKDEAHDVLTALLEPTPEMIEAGRSDIRNWNPDTELIGDLPGDVFQAMIRKALGE